VGRVITARLPKYFHHKGVWVGLGFEFCSAWVSGGHRERESEARRNKRKKQKVSLPMLHVQGEEEEECRLKRYCFVFLLFFYVRIQK